MRKIPHIFSAAILFATSLIACSAMAAGDLVLGVQDYGKSPRMISLVYREMTKYLSAKLGQPVIVEPVQSYERYMERAKMKHYDIMFGPPSMVMEANTLAGYEPVAKVPGLLSAAFMSLADGIIAFPEDMKGKRIGMPDENSLMTMLAFAKLREMKIDPKKYFGEPGLRRLVPAILLARRKGLADVRALVPAPARSSSTPAG